jgi:hypothetical protein
MDFHVIGLTILAVILFMVLCHLLIDLFVHLLFKFKRAKPLTKLLVLIPLLAVGAIVLLLDVVFGIIIILGFISLFGGAKSWIRKM